MKKIITLTLAISILLGCSSGGSDSNSSSSSTNYKWRFKLDGVLYQWEGTRYNSAGIPSTSGGTYGTTASNLARINLIKFSEISVSIQLPQISTGTFPIDQNSTTSYVDITKTSEGENYSTEYGNSSSMNVVITSLPPLSENNGKVIGTFSGTIKKFGGSGLSSVTDGTFEIWRQ
jgi:hypothetical protein